MATCKTCKTSAKWLSPDTNGECASCAWKRRAAEDAAGLPHSAVILTGSCKDSKHDLCTGCDCDCHSQPKAPRRESQTFVGSTTYVAGEFAILGQYRRQQRVLIALESSVWMHADDEANMDAGYYTEFAEPTEEEKQSAEYQRLVAQLAADLAYEEEATKRAQRNSEDPDIRTYRAELDTQETPQRTYDWRTMSAAEIDEVLGFQLNTTRDLENDIYQLRMVAKGKAVRAGDAARIAGRILDAGNPDHIYQFYYDRMREADGKEPKYNIAAQYPEPTSTGFALIAPAPEVQAETVTAPALYCIAPNGAGRWELAINGVIFPRTYAHKSSAYRAARREVARHA